MIPEQSMNEVNTVIKLKKAAHTNGVFEAVLRMFAKRQRARADVTIGALAQRMKKEGHNFEPKDYEPVLKCLADLGFGRLECDKNGRIKALREVKTSLQSIGLVATSNATKLEHFNQRNKFESLVAKEETINRIWDSAPSVGARLNIAFSINDKVVNMEVPRSLTLDEVNALITKLNGTN
jgi:hypothetical protein